MNFMREIYDIVDAWSLASAKKTAPSLKIYMQDRGMSNDDVENIDEKLESSLNVISSNVSALLTHVSAMIAAAGLMLIVFDASKFTQTLIAIEMLGYCIATFLCIANLPYTHLTPLLKKDMNFDPSDKWNLYIGRRYLYVFSAYIVGFLTICLFITIIIHILIG